MHWENIGEKMSTRRINFVFLDKGSSMNSLTIEHINKKVIFWGNELGFLLIIYTLKLLYHEET